MGLMKIAVDGGRVASSAPPFSLFTGDGGHSNVLDIRRRRRHDQLSAPSHSPTVGARSDDAERIRQANDAVRPVSIVRATIGAMTRACVRTVGVAVVSVVRSPPGRGAAGEVEKRAGWSIRSFAQWLRSAKAYRHHRALGGPQAMSTVDGVRAAARAEAGAAICRKLQRRGRSTVRGWRADFPGFSR
jgi:hypothetical protein